MSDINSIFIIDAKSESKHVKNFRFKYKKKYYNNEKGINIRHNIHYLYIIKMRISFMPTNLDNWDIM